MVQSTATRQAFRSAAMLVAALAVLSGTALAEDGVTDHRIVFGQSAAFEGPAASLGTAFRHGLDAAFDEANRNGGVHGRTLDLISYDDGYEPEQAITNITRLIDGDKVFALVGEVGTPTSRAVQPIAEKSGVPFIGPFTGAAFLRDPGLENVINIRASYDEEAEALVRYLVDDLGFHRIAILYQDDTYGRAGLTGVNAALERRGMEAATDGTYRRNTTAVKRALLSIRRADPQAVIIIGAYKPTATFIETAADIGVEPVFATVSFVGSQALADELGNHPHEVIVSQVVPLFDDRSQKLVDRFQDALATSAPEAEPGFVALEGYLTGRLVVGALDRLGPDPTREGFLDLFKTPVTFDIDGLKLTFDDGDNQGSDDVFLTRIQPDGTFAAVDDERE